MQVPVYVSSIMGNLMGRSTTQQTGGGFRQTDVPDDVTDGIFEELDVHSGFRMTLTSKRFVRTPPTADIDTFLTEFMTPLSRYILESLRRYNSVRVAVYIYPVYVKDVDCEVRAPAPLSPVLRTKLYTVLRPQTVPQLMHTILETLRARHINFMRDGSGLHLDQIRIADVQVAKLQHLAYTGFAFVQLPPFLKKQGSDNKRAQ